MFLIPRLVSFWCVNKVKRTSSPRLLGNSCSLASRVVHAYRIDKYAGNKPTSGIVAVLDAKCAIIMVVAVGV